MAMQIRVMHLNATNLAVRDETDWYPVAAETRGELFAELQKEHGSAETMYLDVPRPDAAHLPYPAVPIAERREYDEVPGGWVFTRTEAYEDDPTDTYKHETWVEVRDVEPQADADADLEAG